MKKVLIIVRGLPGSGKSTFAELISANGKYPVCTADDYFLKDVNGETVYQFDPSKLKDAHEYCIRRVANKMAIECEKIIVANTNTMAKELQVYFDLAKSYNYEVISLIVENRHGNKNIHGVPADTLERMKQRFDIKL